MDFAPVAANATPALILAIEAQRFMQRKSAFAPALLLALFLFGSGGSSVCPAATRSRLLFDAGWRFRMEPPSTARSGAVVTGWRCADASAADVAPAAPAFDDSAWKPVKVGDDVFQGRVGYAWFRAVLPSARYSRRVLSFASVDDIGDVYVNGIKLTHHEGWDDPFDVPVDAAWKPAGRNVVAVLVQNTAGPGGLYGSVTLGAAGNGTLADPNADDGKWRKVHLPHDYVVEGPIDNPADSSHGGYTLAPAWYRKTFTVPASDRGKCIWIDFDGAYRDARVYLNGEFLGEHPSGYTSFRFDLTGKLRFGQKNVLAVRIDPRAHEGWWYEGGGIYRHVWLNIASPLHVAPWGAFVTSSVTHIGEAQAEAALSISTQVVDAQASAGAVLTSRILDSGGAVVAQAKSIIAVRRGTPLNVTQTALVKRPHLWSLEAPYLYRLDSVVSVAGAVVDATQTPFGIRTIRFDAEKGFFLNGKHVKIQGVCNHQDFAGVGVAVPDSLEAWRVAKLKAMGCNGWRMSHNPPTPELLDACDRLGMLVMDENRHLGDTYGSKASLTTASTDLSDLESMVLRDRNHPSIILWSMCNEENIQGTPQAAAIFKAMAAKVRQFDASRPISCAMNQGWFEPDGIASTEDLLGVNYNYNVFDRFHAMHPAMPIYASETASTVSARGEYGPSQAAGYVNCYHMTDSSWIPVATRDFVAGSFAWTGFDYKGEPSPFKWPNINSNFGILDMCGFPKDNFYYYKSWWTDRPVVHLLPHWNWRGQEGQPIRVIAFSNCQSVELFLNGKSLGSQDMPRNGHLQWSVPYQAGALTAKGSTGGKVVAQDTVETTGDPAAIEIKADRTVLAADGEDVIPVEADIVDSRGRVVPGAANRVLFTIAGAGQIAGTGNGDPVDHEPDTGSERNAFNGKCLVVIRATEVRGPIRLTAKSDGLAPASLSLQAK